VTDQAAIEAAGAHLYVRCLDAAIDPATDAGDALALLILRAIFADAGALAQLMAYARACRLDGVALPALLADYIDNGLDYMALGDAPALAFGATQARGRQGAHELGKSLGAHLAQRYRDAGAEPSDWKACRRAAAALACHGVRMHWRNILRELHLERDIDAAIAAEAADL